MRWTATALALAAALCLGALAHAAPDPRGPQLASVRILDCSRLDHAATFYGRMRRVAGADRMGMRFTLLERVGGAPFQPVRVPGLGRWRKSRSNRVVFGVSQRVRNLVDGGAYRMRVNFRWYDKDGNVVQRARRRSAPCRQFGPRPNLQVRLVSAQPTETPGVVRYTVDVSNRGNAAASNVDVRLSVNGGEVDTKTVSFLGRGVTKTLGFRGPSCQGTVQAAADPANAIPESSETDNADSRSCAELQP